MIVVKVIVDVPVLNVNQTFDYEVPEQFTSVIEVGMRVLVPFGPRKVMGFVVELSDNSTFTKLRSLVDVLDIEPALTKELIEIGKWLADETLCFYVTAYSAMLPQALKSTYDKIYELIDTTTTDPRLQELFSKSHSITHKAYEQSNLPLSVMQKAVRNNQVEVRYIVKDRGRVKKVTMVKPLLNQAELQASLMDLAANATKQRDIIEHFTVNPNAIISSSLKRKLSASDGTLKALVQKGILTTYQQEILRNPFEGRTFKKTKPYKLTKEQNIALESISKSISANKNETFLLYGVTGSGKTEVYLQAIDKVLQKGQEAIVLVPEIALTPQMVTRFKERFGKKVAVMHSALSVGEKYDEWRKIQKKQVQVVVGARSAIFAPFENLGIIIIDEEHETTYKQEDQPRYHARDVAIERAKKHQCPVVLGSATPTLESFARAQKDVYHLLELTKRTNQMPLPPVHVVDMREELQSGNRSMFSRSLMEGIKMRLVQKEQVVLLLNRRGFATFIMCRDCGFVEECPHCDISLTYHKNDHQLKCHYCMYISTVPTACPSCESEAIRHFGTGTQKVEEELTRLIPEARIIRMDIDTTRRKGSHERLLDQFRNEEADILLGTQMIAKGLDFEKVTLVGVLTADSMLNLPDFRSSERTFQLLTQVSGRAGRHDLLGEVFVQTYTPEHYSIQLASTYNYIEFYKKEMMIRKRFNYPPYVFLVLINISHINQIKTIQTAQSIAKILRNQIGKSSIILGPTPSPLGRIKNRYRYQIIIKYKTDLHLREALQQVLDYYQEEILKKDLQVRIDTKPYHFM